MAKNSSIGTQNTFFLNHAEIGSMRTFTAIQALINGESFRFATKNQRLPNFSLIIIRMIAVVLADKSLSAL
ncbi:MAG: hypothetical protein GY814_06270 [Gammaproteobacteria bacterium]|nr:hypothetical protein [Gammaproteobacteria bacterium]